MVTPGEKVHTLSPSRATTPTTHNSGPVGIFFVAAKHGGAIW